MSEQAQPEAGTQEANPYRRPCGQSFRTTELRDAQADAWDEGFAAARRADVAALRKWADGIKGNDRLRDGYESAAMFLTSGAPSSLCLHCHGTGLQGDGRYPELRCEQCAGTGWILC